jgi:hypothetical protein
MTCCLRLLGFLSRLAERKAEVLKEFLILAFLAVLLL